MNWNYYALLISIIKGYTPEQAFEALEEGKPLQWVDKGQAQEMSELRDQGYKYKEIGAMFNVSADVAFKRIKTYREGPQRSWEKKGKGNGTLQGSLPELQAI